MNSTSWAYLIIFDLLGQIINNHPPPISIQFDCEYFRFIRLYNPGGSLISIIKSMQADKPQSSQNAPDDLFADSKLFNQALSQQSSHYIQSKLLSLPKQAQDLKKLDLRHMCQTVVKQLEIVQKQAAYDYIKVSEELQSLGSELTVADNIMEELETVLYNFKDHLEAIKSEMTSLQQKSNKMNTSLSNKKKVQGLLSSFIESAVLDKDLIDAICLSEINDNYVNHIRLLLKKLNYLNSNLISPDSKAVKQLQPQLQKLKARASVRLRQFLLEQINLLKKPKTNIQIVQKNVLCKYKVFTEFFKQQSQTIYTQICNNYREVMAKIYVSNYKIYLGQIQKLQIELYTKSDQLLPLQPKEMRTFIEQIKPTSLNQGSRSIFSLMGRDRIIDQNESNDVILYNVASQKGQKFTLEQTFKSVNKSLIDGVIHEVIFTAEFFNVRSEAAVEIFSPLFRPSLQLFLDYLKRSTSNTYDIFALLLMVAINQKNRKTLQERGCSALDNYFNQVNMILWPKFEELFQFQLNSCTLPRYKTIQKATGGKQKAGNKIMVDRFVDFVVSYYRLFFHFPTQQFMMEKRLQELRRVFLDTVNKSRLEFERESEGLGYYLAVLEQLHAACTGDPVVANFKEFHVYQLQLEKEVGTHADKIVIIYIREFFPNLDAFIRKYCKEEGSISEQSVLSIQGTVDPKALESTLAEVSTQAIGDSCEKHHSGYSLKAIIRKFSNIFTRYYGEIYKNCKTNHPEFASTMLQTHSMIKELKNTFSKYNP